MDTEKTRIDRAEDDDESEAILAADDTGMLAEQRLITQTEIAEELGTEPPSI